MHVMLHFSLMQPSSSRTWPHFFEVDSKISQIKTSRCESASYDSRENKTEIGTAIALQ
jgi:hypothetical protein